MKITNLFGKISIGLAGMAVFCAAQAADSPRSGRSAMGSVNVAGSSNARMPVQPIVGLHTIGNPAVETIDIPAEADNGISIKPNPNPNPNPNTECPDGGVKNSSYTVTNCMNDVLQCINTGALQGGLHDMFNEEVRNSIMNGMKLCQTQVDRCISEVRVDCRNVYNISADVWLDFNSRIVQPEYYNFVLRKTGLTPNQAENTCLLLDRNTYGSSFAAVSDMNAVNTEYNNKVGAYNSANNGTLSKDNPQGVAVNTVGYDGNRGHYARWDAVNAECLVRVGAYNKDKQITNSWLFGSVGDDRVAEVWQKAGSTFTCDKELFDFDSLLNDTKTAAVVGVGSGTVLGTAIGAAAGAGAYENKKVDCDNPEYVARLGNYIKNVMHEDFVFSNYIGERLDFDNLTSDDCRKINDLNSKLEMYDHAIEHCENRLTLEEREEITKICSDTAQMICNAENINEYNVEVSMKKKLKEYVNNCSFKSLNNFLIVDGDNNPLCTATEGCVDAKTISADLKDLRSLLNELDRGVGLNPAKLDKGAEIGKGAAIGAVSGAAAGGLATAITAFVERGNISCKVGDGLGSVSLGKAYTIDSLKDFYVKWNLHLPDTVSPTSAVTDKASWEQACAQFNGKLEDCPKVQINLKLKGKNELIQSVCKVSGSICIANEAIMKSRGL